MFRYRFVISLVAVIWIWGGSVLSNEIERCHLTKYADSTSYFSGSNILEDINQLKNQYKDKLLSREEGEKKAKEITRIYLNNGYITSRVIAKPENDSKDLVRLHFIEGELADIEIEPVKKKKLWLRSSYICNRLKFGAGAPLNSNHLEGQLRQLKGDPLLDHIAAIQSVDKK